MVLTTGFNVPLFFTAETEPQGGSHISKHITRPITLLEDDEFKSNI